MKQVGSDLADGSQQHRKLVASLRYGERGVSALHIRSVFRYL